MGTLTPNKTVDLPVHSTNQIDDTRFSSHRHSRDSMSALETKSTAATLVQISLGNVAENELNTDGAALIDASTLSFSESGLEAPSSHLHSSLLNDFDRLPADSPIIAPPPLIVIQEDARSSCLLAQPSSSYHEESVYPSLDLEDFHSTAPYTSNSVSNSPLDYDEHDDLVTCGQRVAQRFQLSGDENDNAEGQKENTSSNLDANDDDLIMQQLASESLCLMSNSYESPSKNHENDLQIPSTRNALSLRSKNPLHRREKRVWTRDEVKALEEGLQQYETEWSTILSAYKTRFHPSRTAVDLKDKARNEKRRLLKMHDLSDVGAWDAAC